MKLVTYFDDSEVKVSVERTQDGGIAITVQEEAEYKREKQTIATLHKNTYNELTLELPNKTEGIHISKVVRTTVVEEKINND